ncbi:tripartite tricarboxylate transporter TctB family protein [Brenneria izbisi]|uniref:Tripartite tricarboxylate transporter TctB family protein n=1 Tax=Brenneria izbisi TaxID=2939450 RepID=A0AA41XXR2_9GAMM|nr:tripartite tricarboxylate transporter TctB family protein [Brenneria izbisi]MCV9879409.1 tripartite tricarboxylate transporter TctB family protein [Brenneria izbisi]MCV9882609.1 tripartite tricarboxylate transporter TctB family protein [Brenneria izbisi]
MPKLSLLLPLIFLLFGAGVAAYAFIQLGDVAEFGAGFMPAILGCLMVLLSILDLTTIRLKKEDNPASDNGKREIISVCLVALTVIFYIYFVELLGFILTTSLIMAGLLVFFLPKNKLIAALSAVGLSSGIYYLFSKLLLVPLPSGSLF